MNPVDVVPLDARQAALLHCRYARSWRNPEPGEGAGQLGTSTEPSGDLQWLPEAALAWWCVDDRPADRARVEVLADAPELLARLRGDPRHRIDDRVPQAEGALRRRGAQPGRRLGRHAGGCAEQHGEQAGLHGQRREPGLLCSVAAAGDDDRVDSPGPLIRAWEGPFASVGEASMIAAMPIPAASAVTTISLRSIVEGSFR